MITVVGLGPGEKNMLLPQAFKELAGGKPIYVRTKEHPILQKDFPFAFESFDHVYEECDTFDKVYHTIVERLLELGSEKDIIYAVPGNPLVAEKTVELLKEKVKDLKVLPGVSFLEPMMGALQLDPSKGLQIMDALDPIRLDPKKDTILVQLYSRKVASDVKVQLEDYFADDHPVTLIYGVSTSEETLIQVPLYQLDRQKKYDHLLSLYVPGSKHSYTLDDLVELMSYLRSEQGCPWDKAQTHKSLKPYLIEECLEALEAVDREDYGSLEEELGDVLFQVVFHAQIAREEGYFKIQHVLETVIEKMTRRHSHIFHKDVAKTEEEVLDLWDKNKEKEKSTAEQLADVPQIDLFYMMKKVKKLLDGVDSRWIEDLSTENREFISKYAEQKDFDLKLRQELGKIIKKHSSLQKKP